MAPTALVAHGVGSLSSSAGGGKDRPGHWGRERQSLGSIPRVIGWRRVDPEQVLHVSLLRLRPTPRRGHHGQRARVVAAALAVVVVAVATPAPVAARAGQRRPAKAEWTYLVYMSIDNDVESYGLADLEQMIQAGSTDKVNIIAYVDRLQGKVPGTEDGDLANIAAFDDAKILKVEKGKFTQLADLGEVDTGDPQTLAWFVKSTLAKYPARHYGMTIWDHGNGPFAFGVDYGAALRPNGDRTSSVDPKLETRLNGRDIAEAVRAGLNGAGVDRFDVFDVVACLMANWEFASLMAPNADYLVGSEETMSAETFDFGEVFGALGRNPKMSVPELGAVIERSYLDTLDQFGGTATATQSLIDLRKVHKVDQAVANLARALGAGSEDDLAAYGRARSATLEFSPDPTDPSLGTQLVDLGDLALHLAQPGVASDDVAVAAHAVYQAVKATVVSSRNGSAMGQATGLSIYAPPVADYYDKDYQQVGNPPWRAFLEGYFEKATSTSPTPSNANGSGEGAAGGSAFFAGPVTIDGLTAKDGALFSAELAPDAGAKVTDANYEVGVRTPDKGEVALVRGPAVINSGETNRVAAGWGLFAIQLGDGTRTAPVTVELAPQDGGLRAFATVHYTSSTQDTDAILALTLDPRTAEVQSSAYFARSSADGAYAQLTIDPDAEIVPQLKVYSASGAESQPSTDQGFAASDVQVRVTAIQPGTPIVLGLIASDAAGNASYAETDAVVPR